MIKNTTCTECGRTTIRPGASLMFTEICGSCKDILNGENPVVVAEKISPQEDITGAVQLEMDFNPAVKPVTHEELLSRVDEVNKRLELLQFQMLEVLTYVSPKMPKMQREYPLRETIETQKKAKLDPDARVK